MFARFAPVSRSPVLLMLLLIGFACGFSAPDARADTPVLVTTDPVFTFLDGPFKFSDTIVGTTNSTWTEVLFDDFPNGQLQGAINGLPASAPATDPVLVGDVNDFTLSGTQVSFTPQSPGLKVVYLFTRTQDEILGEIDTYSLYYGTGVPAESQLPICTPLSRSTGQPKPQSVPDVAASLSQATVQNNTPGLTNVSIAANGLSLDVDGLHSGEVRTVDISSLLQPGSNTVVLTALGKPGGGADVCLHE